MSMQLLLGYVGVVNAVILSPIAVILVSEWRRRQVNCIIYGLVALVWSVAFLPLVLFTTSIVNALSLALSCYVSRCQYDCFINI
jgi:hypothetical protein